MSKVLAAIAASLLVFALFSNAIASGNENAGGLTLSSRKVSHYEDSAGSVSQALSNAATKFGIPMGSEQNGQLPTQSVSIQVSEGTVADVISAIMEHAPDYKWLEAIAQPSARRS